MLDSLTLLVVGMGTVFAFLSLLVVAMHLMHSILAPFETVREELLENDVDWMALVAATVATHVHYRGRVPESAVDQLPSSSSDAKIHRVKARIPGRVLSIQCLPNQSIAAGQVLMTLESMKMEVEIRSPMSGTISVICVNTGDMVKQDQTLVMLQ